MKLVVCSDGKYRTDGACINYANVAKPTINSTYFPNTVSSGYWSSSPFADFSGYAWNGDFNNGGSNYYFKNGNLFVRLVREETPPTTTAYTKISNTGASLPDTAVLGSGSNDWACTKDNKTGLIWEVKTDDGGLRDMYNSYTNLNADYPKCDDAGAGWCSTFKASKYGDSTNSDGFVNAVNNQTLCGASDWRLPTKNELTKLIICSDGQYQLEGNCKNYDSVIKPTLDTTYFPNTPNLQPPLLYYWTSTSVSIHTTINVYLIDFYSGGLGGGYRYPFYYVRLVH
jgi:hypothetical protein